MAYVYSGWGETGPVRFVVVGVGSAVEALEVVEGQTGGEALRLLVLQRVGAEGVRTAERAGATKVAVV